eukprot:sb/3474698/
MVVYKNAKLFHTPSNVTLAPMISDFFMKGLEVVGSEEEIALTFSGIEEWRDNETHQSFRGLGSHRTDDNGSGEGPQPVELDLFWLERIKIGRLFISRITVNTVCFSPSGCTNGKDVDFISEERYTFQCTAPSSG